jgi:hypothetical protein
LDDETIQELGPQQNVLDKRIGRLLVLAVPPACTEIELCARVEWQEDEPAIGVWIEGGVALADELRETVEEYVRLFRRFGLVLAGLRITLREEHGWKYQIQYEY